MNRKLNEKVETIFMMPKDIYTFLSSRIIKEIARPWRRYHRLRPAASSLGAVGEVEGG